MSEVYDYLRQVHLRLGHDLAAAFFGHSPEDSLQDARNCELCRAEAARDREEAPQ